MYIGDTDDLTGGCNPVRKKCRICGGDMYHNGDTLDPDFICEDCGFDYKETTVPLCGMCGDSLPVIRSNPKGYRAECDCGLCTPYRVEKRECIDDWKLMS